MHARVADELDKVPQVVVALEIELAGAGLVAAPHDGGLDGVEPGLLGGGDPPGPLGAGEAGVVDRAPRDPHPASVEHEAAPVVGHRCHKHSVWKKFGFWQRFQVHRPQTAAGEAEPQG